MNHQVEILMRETLAMIEKQPPYMVRELESVLQRFVPAPEQLRQDMAA